MKWTINNFPTLEAFCRKHDIKFKFVVEPVFDNILKFIFNKDCSGYTVIYSETQLVGLWLPDWETKLIKKLKNKFNIYDSAVEELDAMRYALFYGKFYKPLEEKVYTQNFKFDNAFLSKPWFPYEEFNKIVKVKLHDEKMEDNKMKRKEKIALPMGLGKCDIVSIKKVIFNDPATIIIWTDDVKTIVKAENEPYDPEKGMAIAIAKRALGNEGNYYDIFRKWIPKKDKLSAMKEMAEKLTNMLLDPKVSTEEYKKGYEEAIKESIKLIDSFKEEKKEPEVIGKVKDVEKTDDGVVVEAKITDNLAGAIREVSKYEKEEKMDSFF